jgi:hypothetical protein
MRRCLYLALVGACCGWLDHPALAQTPPKPPPEPPPSVTVPAEIKVQPGRMARIQALTTGKTVKYANVYDNADLFREYADGFVFRFLADTPGSYKIGFYTDGPSDCAYCVVVVGTPPPPVPPGPPPPPPLPPVPGDGLRVLIVYESDETGEPALPRAKRLILNSQSVRDYLESHCGPDPQKPTWKAYRMWDKDLDATGQHATWAELRKQVKDVPGIVVTNGKESFSGPLPATVDETLQLLKKYGGP